MIFGSVDVLPVYGFLRTNIMKVTNMKDDAKLNPDDDAADFRYGYRDNMIAQFKQDLCHINFSSQDQGKCDQIDTLQNRIEVWLKTIDMGVPVPDNLYHCDYDDEGLYHSVRGAEVFPEIREFKKLLDILRYN